MQLNYEFLCSIFHLCTWNEHSIHSMHVYMNRMLDAVFALDRCEWFMPENTILKKKKRNTHENIYIYENNFSFWCRWKETEYKCFTFSIGHFFPDQQIEWYSNEFQLKQFHCIFPLSSSFNYTSFKHVLCILMVKRSTEHEQYETETRKSKVPKHQSHNVHTFIFISCRDLRVSSAYVLSWKSFRQQMYDLALVAHLPHNYHCRCYLWIHNRNLD